MNINSSGLCLSQDHIHRHKVTLLFLHLYTDLKDPDSRKLNRITPLNPLLNFYTVQDFFFYKSCLWLNHMIAKHMILENSRNILIIHLCGWKRNAVCAFAPLSFERKCSVIQFFCFSRDVPRSKQEISVWRCIRYQIV